MATVVIVHGAFGGGWEWTPVAQRLRAAGHEVFTPTLTGLGERRHLAGPQVDLSTHAQDVLEVIENEGLRDIVLCAASYGGMPATVAADRAASRIRRVVYIDAIVPRDGQAAVDLLPRSFGDDVRAACEPGGSGSVTIPAVALPPPSIPAAVREPYVARLVPQPARTFLEPARLRGDVDRLPRAFVRCVGFGLGPEDPITPQAARAKADGWMYRELRGPHDPHLADPASTAALLDDIAAR